MQKVISRSGKSDYLRGKRGMVKVTWPFLIFGTTFLFYKGDARNFEFSK